MRFQLLPVLIALSVPAVHADEGMWLYSHPPKAQIAKMGFRVTDPFLNHLRLSSLKMGASASFVSANGLILTNHHVASGCIAKLSSAEHNYTADGFYAKSPAEELKCPETEAGVLVRTKDVTGTVNGAVKSAAGSPAAASERRAAIAKLEKDCSSSTGNRCEVVTLYSGALYHLYEYHQYTDIRLVFAPEKSIAFFGGDPDNFTYPRYDLDITFVRAYENGKPAATPNFLKWSRQPVAEGDLVFVSGNPASTDRFITRARAEFIRDTEYPAALEYLKAIIGTLKSYGAESAENKRVADSRLFSAENSYKARFWELKGLQDPRLMAVKAESEQRLRKAIEANAKARTEAGDSWDRIAKACSDWTPDQMRFYLLTRGPQFSDLFRIARTVLRLPEEKAKPNGERLHEYTDANLAAVDMRLYSPAPVTDSIEVAVLATYLDFLQKKLGADDPAVKAALDGRTPQQAAEQYVSTTKLKDIAERRRLATDLNAVRTSDDGMIRLARLLDAPARAIQKEYENRFETIERAAGSRIARARFDVNGPNEYPDATFTLRLSFGVVKGYKNAEGQAVSFGTDFNGLYRHATGEEPFKLPATFEKAKDSLKLDTLFDFVSTADIIGGNSGSPTVNTKGEIVGILFDSNLEAMPNRFIYDEVRGRAVHTAVPGIIEALRNVYHADRVLDEIGFGSSK